MTISVHLLENLLGSYCFYGAQKKRDLEKRGPGKKGPTVLGKGEKRGPLFFIFDKKTSVISTNFYLVLYNKSTLIKIQERTVLYIQYNKHIIRTNMKHLSEYKIHSGLHFKIEDPFKYSPSNNLGNSMHVLCISF